MTADPFEGLGKALALLRMRAGFSTQSEAAEILQVDKGQLSRWEHDSPRPSLENLGRLLAGYRATAEDLAAHLPGGASAPKSEQSSTDEDLLRSLVEAIRRVEGRQVQAEERLEQLERKRA
jgi:transcriptional regulator with XRE-family HTH domain